MMCIQLELQGAIFATQVTFCILKTITLFYAKELKSIAAWFILLLQNRISSTYSIPDRHLYNQSLKISSNGDPTAFPSEFSS